MAGTAATKVQGSFSRHCVLAVTRPTDWCCSYCGRYNDIRVVVVVVVVVAVVAVPKLRHERRRLNVDTSAHLLPRALVRQSAATTRPR
jgi:hypothetical protein